MLRQPASVNAVLDPDARILLPYRAGPTKQYLSLELERFDAMRSTYFDIPPASDWNSDAIGACPRQLFQSAGSVSSLMAPFADTQVGTISQHMKIGSDWLPSRSPSPSLAAVGRWSAHSSTAFLSDNSRFIGASSHCPQSAADSLCNSKKPCSRPWAHMGRSSRLITASILRQSQ